MYPQDLQNGNPQDCSDVAKYCADGKWPCCEQNAQTKDKSVPDLKERNCALSAINLNGALERNSNSDTVLTAGWMTIKNMQAVCTPILLCTCNMLRPNVFQAQGAAICASFPDSLNLFNCSFWSNTAEVIALNATLDLSKQYLLCCVCFLTLCSEVGPFMCVVP